MTCRFALLRHEVPAGYFRGAGPGQVHDHLDWLFEVNGALRTWATDIAASFARPFECAATELPPHRLAYLEREGDIGGGRGRVRRLVSGDYRLRLATRDRWSGSLHWIGDEGRPCGADFQLQRRTERVTGQAQAAGEGQVSGEGQFSQRNTRESPDADPALAVWRLRFSPWR